MKSASRWTEEDQLSTDYCSAPTWWAEPHLTDSSFSFSPSSSLSSTSLLFFPSSSPPSLLLPLQIQKVELLLATQVSQFVYLRGSGLLFVFLLCCLLVHQALGQ